MDSTILNTLFSFWILCFSIYTIYFTWKFPAAYYSTDMKGYISGILFSIMAIMSISGKFSFTSVVSEILCRIFKNDCSSKTLMLIYLSLFLFLVLAMTYFSPNKIKVRIVSISKSYNIVDARIICRNVLFYSLFILTLIYLAMKI
jgi:hypothetical protein